MKRFVADALLETNTSASEYGEDKLAIDCSRIYLRIWREIVNTHEDFFWNYWITDLQAGATEYEIERHWVTDLETDTEIPGIDKVKKVYIKEGDIYVEIPQLSDYQERAGMKGWVLKDNHIILTRVPQEDVEDGLKLEGICSPNFPDWTDDGVDDIFPYRPELGSYQPILSTALKINLWRAKQDFEKMNIAKQDYAEELMELKRYLTERVQDIYYTNLTY